MLSVYHSVPCSVPCPVVLGDRLLFRCSHLDLHHAGTGVALPAGHCGVTTADLCPRLSGMS